MLLKVLQSWKFGYNNRMKTTEISRSSWFIIFYTKILNWFSNGLQPHIRKIEIFQNVSVSMPNLKYHDSKYATSFTATEPTEERNN